MSGVTRYIVITWGSMGDVHPYLGIAAALKARGHPVQFLTNDAFREVVEPMGLPFHALGTRAEAEAILDDPDLWHPRKGFNVVWRSCVATQKLIADYLLGQPDAAQTVVIAHPLALPGAITARDRIAGLKVVTGWMAPSNLRTTHDPLVLGPLHIPRWVPRGVRSWLWHRVDADILDPLTLPDINALRAAHGLAPTAHYADLIYEAPDIAVTLFPEWFGPTMPDWPAGILRGDFMLFDGIASQPMSVELQQFLDAGEKPIVFTFGSAMQHAGKAFQASLDACQRLNRRGLFLTLFPEQIPANLPPTVRWFEYAPFCHLLPHVAAVVHHGGIGSTAEAMRAGVPQIVVPMAHDQFDNGARVEALGIGACIARHMYRAGKLTRVLGQLLDNAAVNGNCLKVASHFSDQNPAASLIEKIDRELQHSR